MKVSFGRYEGHWADINGENQQSLVIDDKLFYSFDTKRYPNSVEGHLLWTWNEKRASNHLIHGIEKVRGYYYPQTNLLICIGIKLTDDYTKKKENYLGQCAYQITLNQNHFKQYIANSSKSIDYGSITLQKVATSSDILHLFQNNNQFEPLQIYIVNIIIDYLHFSDGPLPQYSVSPTSNYREWHHEAEDMFNMFLRRSPKTLWYLVKDLVYCNVKETDYENSWCDIETVFNKCGEERQINVKIKMLRIDNPFSVHIGNLNQIYQLKQKIESFLLNNNNNNSSIILPFNKQRLLHKGRTLNDGQRISDYFINDGDILYLLESKEKTITETAAIINNIKLRNDNRKKLNDINHGCYTNVICQKCGLNTCLTKPILVFAAYSMQSRSDSNNQTLSELVSNSESSEESNNCLLHCGMNGCKTQHIRAKDYVYHCSNLEAHPNGFNVCQNCAKLISDPFGDLNDIKNNHILSEQLDSITDLFFVKYYNLINIVVFEKELHENDEKEEEKVLEVIQMNNQQYVRIDDGIILKARYDAIQKDKKMTFNELSNIITNGASEFRQKIAAVIQNPRIIRDVLVQNCPKLMSRNQWIRKLVNQSFEHIECRHYVQQKIHNDLNDLIETVNDIKMEKQMILINKNNLMYKKMLPQTFQILTPKSLKWINSNKLKNCQNCGTSFGIFTKKVHCVGCGEVFCKKHCLIKKCYPNKQIMGNPNASTIILELALCNECCCKYSYYSWKSVKK